MKILIIILFTLFAGFSARTQSNSCSTATPLTECTVFNATNTGATIGPDDSYSAADICATSLDNSVWFSFTPSVTGAYTIQISNFVCSGSSLLETGVFSGTCSSLTALNCDANSTALTNSFNAVAGQTYFIVIDGASASDCSFDVLVCPGCNLSLAFTPNVTTGAYPLTVNFTNTSTGVHYSHWDFGLLDPGFDGANAVYTYNEPGTYVVSLVGYNGVCSDTLTDTIVVSGPSTLEIPNVFSPNGDGVNDVFKPICIGIDSLEASIYNRWGDLVGWWNGVNGWWDGYSVIAGLPASEGVYYFHIKAQGVDGTAFDEKGILQLFK